MWSDVIPGILVAAVLLIVPGAVVLTCCRLRLTTAVVAAPAASLTVIALSTLVASAVGSTWDGRWVLLGTLACALACALWSWATPWGRRGPSASLLSAAAAGQYLVGQVIAAVFMAPLYLTAFIGPNTIAQRYDNVFHLNAIEAITRTGQATPMDTAALNGGAIYPNAWHTAGALVQDLSGLELAPSVHALVLVTVLGVWPLSMWLLIETLVQPSAVGRLSSGILILACPGFPLVLLDWGLVYPTILGLAVAPAFIAGLVLMLRYRTLISAPVRTALVIGALGLGVGIAHPGAALVSLIMVLPLVAVTFVRHVRSTVSPRAIGVDARHVDPERGGQSPSRGDVAWTAVLAAMVPAIMLIWFQMTPSTDTAPWSRFQTAPQTVVEIVTGGVMGRPVVPVVSLLVVAGVVGAIGGWTRGRVALLALLGPAAAYFSSAALDDGALRDLLSGFFYRDSFRTGAALTMATVPVAVAGFDMLVRGAGTVLDRITARLPLRRRNPRTVAAAVVGLVGVGASLSLSSHISSSPVVQAQFTEVSDAYLTWGTADLVSTDEFAMLEILSEFVPEDGFVIADPWEGGGLVYALGDRDVNQLYMLLPRTAQERDFDRNFRDIGQDSEMCEVLPDDRPLFYLDLDEHRLGGNEVEWEGYQGYQGISASTPGFKLVHEIGDVQLYRLTAC